MRNTILGGLNQAKVNEKVALIDDSWSQRDIAVLFGCSQRTIGRLQSVGFNLNKYHRVLSRESDKANDDRALRICIRVIISCSLSFVFGAIMGSYLSSL